MVCTGRDIDDRKHVRTYLMRKQPVHPNSPPPRSANAERPKPTQAVKMAASNLAAQAAPAMQAAAQYAPALVEVLRLCEADDADA